MPPAVAPQDLARPPARFTSHRHLAAALVTRRELRTVHDVIDRRAVRALFQPMVEPVTGEVIGLEALIRGPEGTPYESPRTLMQAGAAIGRLGELDWVCRAAAAEAVFEHAVPAEIALFLKTDSRALFDECPADLEAHINLAVHSRRCVIGLALGESVSLATMARQSADRFRATGFDIALDGGMDRLPDQAVMQLIEPEVVKVDARALATLVATRGKRSLGALREMFGGDGVQLVVKNVEHRAASDLAAAVGANYAQGWYYGRPAALGDTRLHA